MPNKTFSARPVVHFLLGGEGHFILTLIFPISQWWIWKYTDRQTDRQGKKHTWHKIKWQRIVQLSAGRVSLLQLSAGRVSLLQLSAGRVSLLQLSAGRVSLLQFSAGRVSLLQFVSWRWLYFFHIFSHGHNEGSKFPDSHPTQNLWPSASSWLAWQF